MFTILAYASFILGIIASVIEILQYLKILTPKHKLLWFCVVSVITAFCFYVYHVNETRNEEHKIVAIKNEFLVKDANSVVNTIILTGWEENGNYLGYLALITGFYYRHKENYSTEYYTYNRQLVSWMKVFESKQGKIEYIDISELKGLVIAGRDNIEKIYQSLNMINP
jgi:hypothetical protein